MLAKYSAAIKSCRTAEQIANVKSTGLTKIDKLMDEIAISAARAGSYDGFDGRHLEACSKVYSPITPKPCVC